jgi:hypothetical protein
VSQDEKKPDEKKKGKEKVDGVPSRQVADIVDVWVFGKNLFQKFHITNCVKKKKKKKKKEERQEKKKGRRMRRKGGWRVM